MIRFLTRWIIHCRAIKKRWQVDARLLATLDPRGSNYKAQRHTFRSRADGDLAEFWHWSKVASEVARIDPRAKTDFAVLKDLADQENADRG